jgi:predicted metal-dependent HD superfamily phosphohydrolase
MFESKLATKSHSIAEDNDTNYFTDADLAILGADDKTYTEFAKAIRKEYAVYPDTIYNHGRKKVLTHFLQMPEIYKTKYFRDKYETRARVNLSTELGRLS